MNFSVITIVLITAIMLFLGSNSDAFAEIIGQELGIINDLIISSSTELYFFELDMDIKSSTWIHDTFVVTHDENGIRNISQERFMYPTELNEDEDYLVFAVLAESCLGQTLCDFQDIIKMSKIDGSFSKIATDLKSAIHISVEEKGIFVSESNGKIWKIANDGSKTLIRQGDHIIMDLATTDEVIYWIEEIEDQNNRILGIKEGEPPKIIDENLKIPYDLREESGVIHWNEIYVDSAKGTITEHTRIKHYQNVVEIKEDFENITPISSESIATYGPYRIFGDFLFLVNNTQSESVIHLMDLNNDRQFDLANIADYQIQYLRNDNNSLYVIGINNEGFIIEKFSLPISVPEFSSFFVFAMTIMGLILIVSLKRVFHY